MNIAKRIETGLRQQGHVLIYGDSREAMKHIAVESVRAVVTSPPYDEMRKNTYGGIPGDKYVDFFMPIAREITRVMAPDGSFVLDLAPGRKNDGFLYDYDARLTLELASLGLGVAEKVDWFKGNPENFLKTGRLQGGAGSGSRFRNCCEQILVYAKTSDHYRDISPLKRPTGPWRHPRSRGTLVRVESSTKSGHGYNRPAAAMNPLSRPPNVLRYPENDVIVATTATNGGINDTYGHSAVWPLELPRDFITYLTQEEDVVLDPFVGSGMTMLAAHLLGRRSIGIDSSKDSIAKAKQRLQDRQVPYLFINCALVPDSRLVSRPLQA